MLAVSHKTFGSEPYLVKIGSHVTVAADVRFITHDGGVWVLRDKHPNIDVIGRIVVGDNVMLGIGSIILPNVSIGSNTVVAAGSVVSRSVPSNCVVAGVPARPIKSIDDYETGVLAKASHIRDLPLAERRRAYAALPEPDPCRGSYGVAR